jgi:hypothetical protein
MERHLLAAMPTLVWLSGGPHASVTGEHPPSRVRCYVTPRYRPFACHGAEATLGWMTFKATTFKKLKRLAKCLCHSEALPVRWTGHQAKAKRNERVL